MRRKFLFGPASESWHVATAPLAALFVLTREPLEDALLFPTGKPPRNFDLPNIEAVTSLEAVATDDTCDAFDAVALAADTVPKLSKKRNSIRGNRPARRPTLNAPFSAAAALPEEAEETSGAVPTHE